MLKPPITCARIDCPERRSVCCGANCTVGTNGDTDFQCSKCSKRFVGGECDSGKKISKDYADGYADGAKIHLYASMKSLGRGQQEGFDHGRHQALKDCIKWAEERFGKVPSSVQCHIHEDCRYCMGRTDVSYHDSLVDFIRYAKGEKEKISHPIYIYTRQNDQRQTSNLDSFKKELEEILDDNFPKQNLCSSQFIAGKLLACGNTGCGNQWEEDEPTPICNFPSPNNRAQALVFFTDVLQLAKKYIN